MFSRKVLPQFQKRDLVDAAISFYPTHSWFWDLERLVFSEAYRTRFREETFDGHNQWFFDDDDLSSARPIDDSKAFGILSTACLKRETFDGEEYVMFEYGAWDPLENLYASALQNLLNDNHEFKQLMLSDPNYELALQTLNKRSYQRFELSQCLFEGQRPCDLSNALFLLLAESITKASSQYEVSVQLTSAQLEKIKRAALGLRHALAQAGLQDGFLIRTTLDELVDSGIPSKEIRELYDPRASSSYGFQTYFVRLLTRIFEKWLPNSKTRNGRSFPDTMTHLACIFFPDFETSTYHRIARGG